MAEMADRGRMKRLLTGLSATGLVVLVAACTAKQVGDVGALPPPLPPSSPSLQTTTPYAAPAPIAGGAPARVARTPEPRIDELYPGSGAMIGAGGGAPGRSAVGDITLDFQDTDLREVVRVILGDLLNVNYVIDPDVAGRVTMSTARPLSSAALGSTLGVILAAQGAHIVNYGDIYRIMRVTDVAQLAGAGIDVGTSGLAGSAGLRVLPLAFIGGDEMAKILEPLLPEGAIVYTDAKRGLLIVGGSSAELALAAETVEIFDIDQMAGQTIMLVSLQNADAKTVAAEVDVIVRVGGATAEPGNQVQLIPIERLNAIMIIARQVAYVEHARAWIFRLDRARSPTEKRMYVYYVQHGRAGSLADALRDALGVGGGAAPLASVEAVVEAEPLSASYAGGLPKAEAGPRSAAAIFGTELRIAVDDEHNALLISATPQEFELIEEVIAKLDIQPLQVMIETSIFEVLLNDTLRYGIQYAIQNEGLGITDDGQITLSSDTLVATTAAGVIKPIIQPFLPGFAFTLDATQQTRLVIDTLSALTEVNMISSPNVLVHNNKTAQLRVGDEVPIVTQTTTSTVTGDPLIVNAVQYRSTGVNLEVTPRVNASGMITLEIYQEVSNVVATDTSGIDSPTIQNRVLISTVTIKSGDTIMLGGLIRERASNSKSGIPILHELPVIGALFGRTDTSAERVELVVLIRPVIVATPRDARAVTADLRRKFLTLLQRESIGVRQPRRIVSEDLQ